MKDKETGEAFACWQLRQGAAGVQKGQERLKVGFNCLKTSYFFSLFELKCTNWA